MAITVPRARTIIIALLVLVFLVLGARFSVLSTFEVTGTAMADTFEPGDVVFVNTWAYMLGSPKRGDVVVFHSPIASTDALDMKRIVGLPGETIVLRDGWVFVRKDAAETKLEELYLNEENQGRTFPSPNGMENPVEAAFEVPADAYFILGDNRRGSLDSRSYEDRGGHSPFIPKSDLGGRVW